MMRRPTFIALTCLIILFGMIFIMVGGCASQHSKLLKKKQQDVLESYRLQISESIDDPDRARQLIKLGEDFYQQIRTDTKVLL